jgi:F-type H+-transporting ATPase subunit epsilon
VKLIVSTPLAIVVDNDDVRHLRAEDETGAFGILPGHTVFLTALAISIVTWRDGKGIEHHIAVRGGMLEIRDGTTITIATRDAILGDDLHVLETEVLASFRRRLNEERAAHSDAQRLYLAAIRQIYSFLKSERAPSTPGMPSVPTFGQLDQ